MCKHVLHLSVLVERCRFAPMPLSITSQTNAIIENFVDLTTCLARRGGVASSNQMMRQVPLTILVPVPVSWR